MRTKAKNFSNQNTKGAGKIDSQKYLKSLRQATKKSDAIVLEQASENIVDANRASKTAFTKTEANSILDELRSTRRFDLMQRVADSFIQSGQQDFRVRRQYAQSLLDQGNITAGSESLKKLSRDTKNKNKNEYTEAQGLLGRAYKQIYVDANNIKDGWVAEALNKSIKHYHQIYKDNPKNLWYGINAAALLTRADKDKVKIQGLADPRKIASTILTSIKRKDSRHALSPWDIATAAEASVGLHDFDEALKWVHRYIKGTDTTAFHLGSFERQMRDVWGLDPSEPPGSQILPLIRKELLNREGATINVSAKEIDAASRLQRTDKDKL